MILCDVVKVVNLQHIFSHLTLVLICLSCQRLRGLKSLGARSCIFPTAANFQIPVEEIWVFEIAILPLDPPNVRLPDPNFVLLEEKFATRRTFSDRLKFIGQLPPLLP